MMEKYELHLGNSLEVLKTLPDNSVGAIVTDPPYGLSKEPDMLEVLRHWMTGDDYKHGGGGFMGKSWDSFVPGPAIWRECYRVLKPGGHMLAFFGTRTQDMGTLAIRLAGFEIRDSIAWVYGCLSEDSEVLTEDGWMPYNRAKQKNILAYDIQNDIYKWEKPSRWNEYRVKSDTAYRIQSDQTDQIVSRGHRCIVERGGMLEFVPADELSGVERVPYLQCDFSALPQGRCELLLKAVLREGEGLVEAALSERQGEEAAREGACRGEKPGMEGWADLLQAQGQVRGSGDQVRALPGEHDEHGPQGRVCDGTSPRCGDGNWQATDAGGVCASHQPRCDGQQAGEPDAVCDQRGSQKVRARASYKTTVATVTAIEYSGLIWCPTVSTGAFVARRNGKVFITGNSGFPKSLDVSKAIDKVAGVEREVTREETEEYHGGENINWDNRSSRDRRDAPATAAARQWQGWGTALKPALEPITVARKPLAKGHTVAANVLACGTGALNIDGCRVSGSVDDVNNRSRKNIAEKPIENAIYNEGWKGSGKGFSADLGRFPANLIHDGSDEVIAAFPSGSAARFFYCAKASKRDRDEGLEGFTHATVSDGRAVAADNAYQRGATERANIHPTVKPTDLMRYLCRLVTPPGGLVLDPFMGSGSTGKAAMLEGFRFIGIDITPEYVEIAKARIEYAMNNLDKQDDLFK